MVVGVGGGELRFSLGLIDLKTSKSRRHIKLPMALPSATKVKDTVASRSPSTVDQSI